jgi:hypothetical protein
MLDTEPEQGETLSGIMRVFVDESGDPGLKIQQGSTPYFVVSLVIFRDLRVAHFQKYCSRCEFIVF